MTSKINRLINIIYISLIVIGIAGALNRLLIAVTKSISNNGMFIVDIILILSLFLLKIKRKLSLKKILLFLMPILIVWQVWVVLTCSGISTWDPGIIVLTATRHFNKVWVNINQYFSTNTNTIPLLLIEHFLWCILNKPNLELFVKILGIINIILVDSSLMFILASTKKIFKSDVIRDISVIFGILIIGVSPWICIPYTDIPAFFLSSLELFLMSFWNDSDSKVKWMLSVLLSIVALCGLLIKPSLIIFFIGIGVLGLFNLKKIKVTFKTILYIFTFSVTFLSLGLGYKFVQNNTSLIKIDKSAALPLSHFAAMGIQGNGGYSLKDVQLDDSIKNPQKRNKVAKLRWKERYNDLGGFFGYEKFLINKQSVNLAMGSMDWGCEGVFLTPFNQSKNVNDSFPRKLFTSKDGIAHDYNSTYFVIIQFVWCIGLILMFFASFDQNNASQLFKIVFIGFCIFLLLFESGRSRYLIQFLPFMFILMGIGYSWLYRIKKIADKLSDF